jgi:serine/threonine protein kinase
VIDFGVARAAERMGRTTARGVVGTPAYIAPEQARDTREASVASDVYSLGATLLFAATGHPPYSGATVLDVLARLASEEPDLSGLPGELTELVAGCMHRVPRQRPTSSAILVQLGDFTVAQAGPDEEHSYLPAKAMALIAEYQRSPQLGPLGPLGAGSGDDRGDDATSASYTELPASYKPAPRRKPGRGRAGADPHGTQGSGWRRWLRQHMAWAGWASVGAALVAVGVILGAALTSSSSPSPVTSSSPGLPVPPPAPPTVCGSSGQPGGGPELCMVKQSRGPADTAWIVRATGFPPRAPVTVTLTWNSPPQDGVQSFNRTARVSAAGVRDGRFQLDIGRLFPGALRLGRFDVQVTGSGDSRATTAFIVIPALP